MLSSDRRKLLLMLLLIAGGRAADELTTFAVDPTLFSEANLFVRHIYLPLGLHWTWALIACLEGFFVLSLAVGLWYYLRSYRSFFPQQPDYSFKRFTAFCWSSAHLSGSQHLRRLCIIGIYGLVATTIPLSYWAAANNLCLLTIMQPIIEADPHHPAIDRFDTVQRWLMLLVPAASVLVAMIWLPRSWYREYAARGAKKAETSLPSL